MVEAAARQPCGSAASGVAAGSNAATERLAAPAAAGGNPPVQAMGNGAVFARVFLALLLALLLFWWSLGPRDTETKHEL